jgi:CrcB protein
MSGAAAWSALGALGALGAYTRFRLGAAVTARHPGAFPLGTFVVNATGTFVLGLLVGLDVQGDSRFVFGTGFLGAFTTFSTWMTEAQRLAEDGDWGTMGRYLAGSMAVGLALTGAGWLLGEALR